MAWWQDPNTRWVLAGCVLMGISSGVLGSFALLRRRSLIGDTVAHAALPGVCLGFLLAGSRSLGWLLLGALVAGLLGAACVQAITRASRLKEDAALGLVLSVFFGFGIVLLTLIQNTQRSSQAGLDKFIFGQAASLVGQDVQVMAACALLLCSASVALFKEFKLLCFDPGFARGLGRPTGLLDGLLLLLLVVAVVIGLQAVGVVLMAAMLITPAAAARFWTERLDRMVWIAGFFGGAAGATGTALSTLAPRMPTGPLIVLAATALFVGSLFFAPRRGLLARVWRHLSVRARVAQESVLCALFEQEEGTGVWQEGPAPEAIAGRGGGRCATGALRRLSRLGLVSTDDGRVRLTPPGRELAAELVRRRRLWELYLMHEGRLGAAMLDRDSGTFDRDLPPETVAELERMLAEWTVGTR